MTARPLVLFAILAGALPLGACVVAEVAAAPIMVAGDLYSGSREGRPETFAKPTRRLLARPGSYVFTREGGLQTMVTVRPDLSIRVETPDCVLEARRAPRLVQGNSLIGYGESMGFVDAYQVTLSERRCKTEAGTRLLAETSLDLGSAARPSDFPWGNHIAIQEFPIGRDLPGPPYGYSFTGTRVEVFAGAH
jgi:hypothetical protein